MKDVLTANIFALSTLFNCRIVRMVNNYYCLVNNSDVN